MKAIIYKILYAVSALLLLLFIVFLCIDLYFYNDMLSSAPFYAYIIIRSLEFLLPSLIIFIVALLLKGKINKIK